MRKIFISSPVLIQNNVIFKLSNDLPIASRLNCIRSLPQICNITTTNIINITASTTSLNPSYLNKTTTSQAQTFQQPTVNTTATPIHVHPCTADRPGQQRITTCRVTVTSSDHLLQVIPTNLSSAFWSSFITFFSSFSCSFPASETCHPMTLT